MSTYLVTGGAGFIGSHIATALVARGDRARVFDNLSGGSLENLGHLEVGEPGSGAPVEFFRGDIRNGEELVAACEGVQGILHEAAQVSVPESFDDPQASYAINVTGTLNVLEAARKQGVKRLVFAASSAAYGDSKQSPKLESQVPEPLSPYASGKVAGEHLLRVFGKQYGIKTVALRYFNVFGPRQADNSAYSGVIALFAKSLLCDRPVTIYGDGEQTRDFVYVENIAAANLLALESDLEPGVVVNVGTGESVSVNALFARMAEITGGTLVPTYGPARAGDPRDSLASCEWAEAALGYAPRVRWSEGLVPTLDWYRTKFATQQPV